MSIGTYIELLPCGGKLNVATKNFWIEYYFQGPDARYSGTFVRIAGEELQSYAKALVSNWREFQELKSKIPAGGEFTKTGEKGMEIRISTFNEGVCIKSYHMPISSQGKLREVLASFDYSHRRASQIQQLLLTL